MKSPWLELFVGHAFLSFIVSFLSHAVNREGGRSAQEGGKVCSWQGWWVWIDLAPVPWASPSYTPLTPSHTLSHTHTHLSHTTNLLTHPLMHPIMHPNKHASHTRQMCWWWRCSRRRESHSPGCLGVQRGRVLETSISNKYVAAHIQTPKYPMSISTYPTCYYPFPE